VGPEAVLLSAMAGLEDALAVAVESTAARVTRQRAKSDRTPSDWYRYAGMAELADATDLKVRAGIRRNTIVPPGAQAMEPFLSARPATAGMSATPRGRAERQPRL